MFLNSHTLIPTIKQWRGDEVSPSKWLTALVVEVMKMFAYSNVEPVQRVSGCGDLWLVKACNIIKMSIIKSSHMGREARLKRERRKAQASKSFKERLISNGNVERALFDWIVSYADKALELLKTTTASHPVVLMSDSDTGVTMFTLSLEEVCSEQYTAMVGEDIKNLMQLKGDEGNAFFALLPGDDGYATTIPKAILKRYAPLAKANGQSFNPNLPRAGETLLGGTPVGHVRHSEI
jgi:hypothetical protein